MKIYVEYEKEINSWDDAKDDIPSYFESKIEQNRVPKTFEEMRDEWISKRLTRLNNDKDCRNIHVSLDDNCIYYQMYGTDYEDTTEVLEIETVQELIAAMKEYECPYFTKDEEHKNRWVIQ